MKKLAIYLNVVCCLTGFKLYAQKDSLSDGLSVIIKYVPTLSESIKIPINPNPEQPNNVKPVFNYQIPNFNTETTPTIYTIKPVSLGNVLLSKLRNNYFKFGYGNYTTPLLEGYVNSKRNKDWNNGVFFKHLSSDGDRDFNNFSNNTLAAHSKRFYQKTAVGASALYHRNVVYNYGFNDTLKANEDTLKNIYNLIDLNVSIENTKDELNGLNYKMDVNYYYQSNNFNFNEHNFSIGANLSKKFNDIPLSAYVAINSINNSLNDYAGQRTAVIVNPRLNLVDPSYYLKVGFNNTYFNDSIDGGNHFYPVGEVGYHLVPKKVVVLAGINGGYQINTFRSINTENPFVRNFEFRNTNNKFEMYGGFKGCLNERLNYSVQGSIANLSDLLFYVQDNRNYQKIIYDEGNTTLTTLTTEISFQAGEKFRLGLVNKLYNYSLGNILQAYSRPNVETKFTMNYNLADKFLIRADIFHVGERISGTFDPVKGNKDKVVEAKLNPFVDLNLGLDYRYNKNISIFLNFNNMAASRYSRFLNYDVYGFNILGGVALTF